MNEDFFLLLGYCRLRDKNPEEFVDLYVNGKLPAEPDDLSGFMMDMEVYSGLVALGRRVAEEKLEAKGGDYVF